MPRSTRRVPETPMGEPSSPSGLPQLTELEADILKFALLRSKKDSLEREIAEVTAKLMNHTQEKGERLYCKPFGIEIVRREKPNYEYDYDLLRDYFNNDEALIAVSSVNTTKLNGALKAGLGLGKERITPEELTAMIDGGEFRNGAEHTIYSPIKTTKSVTPYYVVDKCACELEKVPVEAL